jgi:alpha-D-ribose 1-methylphosphonate 5-triphosphate synthase subunit PhnG
MTATSADATVARRRHAMAVCAEATREEIEGALRTLGPPDGAEDLRRPEVGLVMARGRMGGDGQPFNFGEVTASRAAVRLPTGETGFAYQLGRDPAKARGSAVLDALIQSARADEVERALEPARRRIEAERERSARQAAATRVNFFTMVRGEDP